MVKASAAGGRRCHRSERDSRYGIVETERGGFINSRRLCYHADARSLSFNHLLTVILFAVYAQGGKAAAYAATAMSLSYDPRTTPPPHIITSKNRDGHIRPAASLRRT